MRVGAVITAAGLSSRMGDFKPLLEIGEASMARRVVASLRLGGAQDIVVVTGYRAAELESHLDGLGVAFVRNRLFETSQMFDSVKVGLAALPDSSSRILVCPVDVPLFSPETVRALLRCEEDIVIPISGGASGHPVAISRRAADALLADCGDGGMRAAFARSGLAIRRIEVADKGMLYDADTPGDYRRLLELAGQDGGNTYDVGAGHGNAAERRGNAEAQHGDADAERNREDG